MIGYRVTQKIAGANRNLPDYPLLPDDLLLPEGDGSFFKHGPGLGIGGFVLTDEQKATLERWSYETFGLDFRYLERQADVECV